MRFSAMSNEFQFVENLQAFLEDLEKFKLNIIQLSSTGAKLLLEKATRHFVGDLRKNCREIETLLKKGDILNRVRKNLASSSSVSISASPFTETHDESNRYSLWFEESDFVDGRAIKSPTSNDRSHLALPKKTDVDFDSISSSAQGEYPSNSIHEDTYIYACSLSELSINSVPSLEKHGVYLSPLNWREIEPIERSKYSSEEFVSSDFGVSGRLRENSSDSSLHGTTDVNTKTEEKSRLDPFDFSKKINNPKCSHRFFCTVCGRPFDASIKNRKFVPNGENVAQMVEMFEKLFRENPVK